MGETLNVGLLLSFGSSGYPFKVDNMRNIMNIQLSASRLSLPGSKMQIYLDSNSDSSAY